MTSTVLAPVTGGAAIELGNGLWRKKLLPVGDVQYKGRLLHFTAPYLAGLVDAFRSRAYDQVPLQLADAQNTHSNDPERTRGEVTDMDLGPDGLYVTVRTTDAGSKVLEDNPRIGVSARIVEDYARSDGQHFPAAVQHVLATLDPRIPGLGAWQAIEAANYGGQVIDLSALRWAGEPPPDEQATIDRELAALDEQATQNYLTSGEYLRQMQEDLGLDEEEFADFAAPVRDDQGELLTCPECEHAAPAGDFGAFGASGASLDRQPEALRTPARPRGAQLAGSGYGGGGDLELSQVTGAIEMAEATERARQAEEAAMPRRSSTHDRIQAAYARIGRGTYAASQAATALGLANPSDAGRRLAAARWHPGQEGAVTGLPNCGPSDDLGYCIEQNHALDCGSLADPVLGEALSETGVYADIASRPWTDQNDRTWSNQAGGTMNLTQHLEVATGTRMVPDDTSGGWQSGTGARELVAAQRVLRFADTDDEDDPGYDAPADTRAVAGQVAAAMGISPADSGRERGRYAEKRAAALARVETATGGRRHPDFAESTRDRAARIRTPVEPVQLEDTWHGSLAQYVAGTL